MSVRIVGLGSYHPSRIVSNEEISKTVDTTDEWIFNNLGIKERRISEQNQLTSDLAYEATKNALHDAKMIAEDLDFIILCTSSPDRISPSTACILQEKLGIINTPCIDINAVCSGFLYGLQIAKGLLVSNTYKRILVVASETYSKITDWSNRNCVFFGDGSGAVILEKDDDNFFELDLYADGRGKESFTVPIGGKFSMDGKEVFRNGIEKLPKSIEVLLDRTKINTNQIDFIIPHQPSINILKKTAEIVGVPFHKVITSMGEYANTAGASIPVTLNKVYKEGKLQNGNILLLTSIGSGWVWGSGLIKWKK